MSSGDLRLWFVGGGGLIALSPRPDEQAQDGGRDSFFRRPTKEPVYRFPQPPHGGQGTLI